VVGDCPVVGLDCPVVGVGSVVVVGSSEVVVGSSEVAVMVGNVVPDVRGVSPVELISVMKMKYATIASTIPTSGRAICQ
jgi:hypothetical protein